ncbi:uncharacterized protein LOC114155201 [Xiphophorus couchianus]|uniref:uncharacterized protein LOC114155201 n=1 Tax=Xiphophorus couchianus TaxID=32473 RepID=UPI001015FC7B|nr:uncharacterized protein LOC114155201 [Xiphophorus couchianus]
MKDFNKDIKDGPFLLLYPDGTEVINIPGTQTPFTLKAYKAEIGKSYQRISLFLCLKRDFEEVGKLSDSSDSDPEVVIRKNSEFDHADTLPWEPMDESSPLQKVAETENGVGDLVLANEVQQVMDLDNNGNNPGTSQCLTVQSSCYRDYTTLFESIVIDDDDEIEYFTEDKKQDLPPEEHLQTCSHMILLQNWPRILTTRKSAGSTYVVLMCGMELFGAFRGAHTPTRMTCSSNLTMMLAVWRKGWTQVARGVSFSHFLWPF